MTPPTVLPGAPAPDAPGPRALPIGRGTAWLGEGYDLFRQAIGPWIGVLFLWLAISMAMGALHLDVLSPFLNPILSAGLMLGCAALARGEPFGVGFLFAGFRSARLPTLLMLGVWTIVFVLAALLLAAIVLWAPVIEPARGLAGQPAEEIVRALGFEKLLLVLLVVLSLVLLLAMATFFAPALIVLGNVAALAAMKLSLLACWRNFLPLLLYGLVAIVIIVLAIIPLGLGLLVAIPVFIASGYAAYRDIFPGPAAPAAP